jgi:hypothetical protein
MALVFEGVSQCPLCGRLLKKSDAFALFPPMTNNMNDPLFIFSDAGVHTECVNLSQYKEELDRCMVLHANALETLKAFKNPRDILFLGLLTSDKREGLYRFNYRVLNLAEISIWKEYEEFIFLLQQFTTAGKYKPFVGMDTFGKILNALKEARNKV